MMMLADDYQDTDCDDYDDYDDDNRDDDADEYVEVNTLKVVRGKRANSLKWDHTEGGGGVGGGT